MLELLKTSLASSLSEATGFPASDILPLLERPRNPEHGDLAFPCFQLAKSLKKAPADCARVLSERLGEVPGFMPATVVGPFLNFAFERTAFTRGVLEGSSRVHKSVALRNKNILVEYSSPNIAKPFHVGHLRATLIGNSLDRVYRFLNANVVSVNHLGDWGTQFGFVWAGCKLWGKPEQATVAALVDLYRKATALKEEQDNAGKEIPADDDVNLIARNYFIDLEAGADYAVEFWKWCLEISLQYLKNTYKRLDINFDHYLGESFYSDKLDTVTQSLTDAGILNESEKALGVLLGEQDGEDLGFARITTPDGRSLYLARDLAAAEYRYQRFAFDESIYVVGAPQALHFKQMIAILKKLGKPYAEHIHHVAFGHVMGMKTRGGGSFIELNGFLDEARELALKAYREQVERRPEGLDEEMVAEAVAHAAIIFSNLSRTRIKDVHFSWENALAFQGDSGPYLLYAYARTNGIREKSLTAGITGEGEIDFNRLTDEYSYSLAACIADFSKALDMTIKDNDPAHLANYGIQLAKNISRAYNQLKVVGVEATLGNARLKLFLVAGETLKNTLQLLGIPVVERM
ncbi:MAG: arginine--tRNA ligase [bacterium]|nr:arginine--tRNA ligase [bacterium]